MAKMLEQSDRLRDFVIGLEQQGCLYLPGEEAVHRVNVLKMIFRARFWIYSIACRIKINGVHFAAAL